MDYIKGATDYLGITATEPEGQPLATAAPGASGAVSASELIAKKDLNDEILDKNSSVLTSTKPDVSSKREINDEIRNAENPKDLLHHHNSLPDTSAKRGLNDEIKHSNPTELLHHNNSEYDSELRKKDSEYQGLSLNTAERGINLDSPSISSRPEFQKTPFTAPIVAPIAAPIAAASTAILPPQMATQPLPGQHFTQTTVHSTNARAEPIRMETIQKDVVVHERIHPVQKEEIQPVIYREREQLDVKQVTQMMHETQIQPTLVQQRELPAQHREAIVERGAPIPENFIAATREVDATQRTQVVHAPIVQEVIRKTVVEEVQPVLERDVFVPSNVQITQPVYEKIIEAPRVTREVIEVRELGTHHSGMHTGMTSGVTTMQTGMTTTMVGTETLQSRRLSTGYEADMSSRRLSSGSVNSVGVQSFTSEPYNPNYHGFTNNNMTALPTGQVLPQVGSSRPAYAYLPSGYTEKRPDFIGTGAQYALAANGLQMGPQDLQKGLYNPYIGGAQGHTTVTPQAYPRQ